MSGSAIEIAINRAANQNTESWPNTLARPIRQGIAWIAARRRRHRDVNELLALDDRILRDIGLQRSEVELAARFGKSFERYKDGLQRRPIGPRSSAASP